MKWCVLVYSKSKKSEKKHPHTFSWAKQQTLGCTVLAQWHQISDGDVKLEFVSSTVLKHKFYSHLQWTELALTVSLLSCCPA